MVNAAREEQVRKRVEELADALADARPGSDTIHLSAAPLVAEELGELGHPDAIAPLSEAVSRFQDYVNYDVWKASVKALAKINDPRATSFLINAFKKTKKQGNERAIMVWALGETKRAAVIPYLARVASSEREHWSIREAAIRGLGNFPHPKAVKALAKNLASLRIVSTHSLLRIGKAIGKKPVSDNYSRALQLISPHLREEESPEVINAAYGAALKGKITRDNARLYVKQLRAQQGNLK